MAEGAVGLSVGVLGLAGLFKTALDVWELADAARSFEGDSAYFQTRLHNQRFIFLLWADQLGLFSPEQYSASLSSRIPQIESNFSLLAKLFNQADQLVDDYGFELHPVAEAEEPRPPGPESATRLRAHYVRMRAIFRPERAGLITAAVLTTNPEPEISVGFWKRTRWAVSDRGKCETFVNRVASIVQELRDMTHDIQPSTAVQERASEFVRGLDEASLHDLEQYTVDEHSVISDAASICIRNIEEGRRSIPGTVKTTGTSFFTAKMPVDDVLGVDCLIHGQTSGGTVELDPTDRLDFNALVQANNKACTQIVATLPEPSGKATLPYRSNRLLKEIHDMVRSATTKDWFAISPISSTNLLQFLASFIGPMDTPYEGGIFHVRIEVSHRYPYEPPRVWFLTKVLHPNIGSNGAICADQLERPMNPQKWSPVIRLTALVVTVASLLSDPNWDDPIPEPRWAAWTENKEEFLSRARKWTREFATGHIIYAGQRSDGFYTTSEGQISA